MISLRRKIFKRKDKGRMMRFIRALPYRPGFTFQVLAALRAFHFNP
jgi:hypothetical protein